MVETQEPRAPLGPEMSPARRITERHSLGAEHARLEGAPALFRYRPTRRRASEVRGHLLCQLTAEGRRWQGVEVTDISSTGLSLKLPEELTPGTRVDSMTISFDGWTAWEGVAEVVHSGEFGLGHVGCKFLSGVLDMEVLTFRSDILNGVVGPALEQLELSTHLPTAWRADLAHYLRLFAVARQALGAAQEANPNWRDQRLSEALCHSVYDVLIDEIEETVLRLHQGVQRFDVETRQIALAYSTAFAQDEFHEGEFLHRAYEKPLGYAGDFWMMELLQMDALRGESLYQRFLHMYVRESAMGIAVRKRGEVAQRQLEEAIAHATGPIRIMSLACGPAIEIRRLLREFKSFKHPVEILLVDQDEHALRECYTGLSRALNERDDLPEVQLQVLHFSLRQIIAPKRGAERALVDSALRGVDFIYSMGMFDYLGQPLARRSIAALHDLLGDGGRLFIGNLMDVPESSWVMEYCTAWHLVYRDQEAMLDLLSGLDPVPEHVDLVRGVGSCLFLDVRKD